jgi:hypothetical protein
MTQWNKRRVALAAALVAASLVGACGGDDDDAPATASPKTVDGTFVDAPVQGLAYRGVPSGTTGTTGADGGFRCAEGDQVTFSIGTIALGSAACGATVTPADVAGTRNLAADAVVNRLLFLQSLDDDDQPDNGITLTGALASAFGAATLDFTQPAASFDTAFAALLPAGVNDRRGHPYAERSLAGRRGAAVEHFESTLAGALGQADTSSSEQASAGGKVSITKYAVQAPASLYVPYEGSNTASKADFPDGLYPAIGSGLAFKGRAADGTLEFWGITDRGPNGDSPNAPLPSDATKTSATKMFPAPSFTPSIGVLSVGKGGAVLKSLLPLKSDASTRISGRPVPPGSVGNSGEVPLTDALTYDAAKAGFDPNGLDTESLVHDAGRNAFWTSDEYGPFIVRINATTGVIEKRYAPGSGLPEVLKHRRANRGMEGLAMDAGGALHGFLQSPIDPLDNAGKSVEVLDTQDLDGDGKTNDKVKVRDFAPFARWVRLDPTHDTTKTYAYPLSYPLAGTTWDRNRTGSAKLGDLVALGDGRFIVIEQGADASGAVRNFLMLVEIPSNATDIGALGTELEQNAISPTVASSVAWTAVVPLKKRVLLDLNAAGWQAEKAEGLAIVDDRTLALINDNDFGLRTVLVDANGKAVDGDPTACTVDAAGAIVADGNCATGAVGVRVTRGLPKERATRLWLLKLPQALTSYGF